MQINSTSRKAFEVMGTTLTKRFLEKKGVTKESFLIPIDLHQELFVDLNNDNKERADNLVAKIDSEKKEILFTIVEIKCRNSGYHVDELHKKIVEQIENTIFALREHFEIAVDGQDRLDRELKVLELRSFLEFYIKRSVRYGCLDPEIAHNYMVFLSKLADGYTIRFKQLGVIFDFQQTERQKKNYYVDAVIYTMGKPVINDVLDEESSLSTKKLEELDDSELINFFEPTFFIEESAKEDSSNESIEEMPEHKVEDHHDSNPDYEIIIPNNSNVDSKVEVDDIASELKSETKDSSSQNVEGLSSVSFNNNEELDDKESSNDIDNNLSVLRQEPIDYEEPVCDVIIGKNDISPQYGILGKMTSNGRRIGLDLNECNTISLFGIQGAGKSDTIGSIAEMVVSQFSKVNKLQIGRAHV